MNLRYIYLLPILLLAFFACGSDDSTSTGVLRYAESKIEEPFKLYTGGSAGAIECDTTNKLKIVDYISSSIYENYSNTTIAFPAENQILITLAQGGVKPEKSLCKFENGSLFIHTGEKYQYFGEGGINSLAIRQHYVGYKTGEGTFRLRQIEPQKEVTAEEVASYSSFGSLENMKLEEDTLVWCTRVSYFR
ncbi:hypothetical protein JGH11_03640 [Dysgonomonas sp. Marseille-P4677]|uniref:hypothetical protein n=1 Tax=Dysgonomonas sp. Marseille-P4677 TaxID=2364790 RepID=UPI0019121FA4|nr:hypothetical protein [Dysgonomonas sp. Marseille-P4677]MBK5719957.1 hypothetical protein [Dysgonomonas sp. Marseille-P4677]